MANDRVDSSAWTGRKPRSRPLVAQCSDGTLIYVDMRTIGERIIDWLRRQIFR